MIQYPVQGAQAAMSPRPEGPEAIQSVEWVEPVASPAVIPLPVLPMTMAVIVESRQIGRLAVGYGFSL